MYSLSHFFNNDDSSYLNNDQIYSPSDQDEDLFYNLNNNNFSWEFHIISNRSNDVFNQDGPLQQNNEDILFSNEERTMEGMTQNPDHHEINNYHLNNYSNYIPEEQINEDSDDNFNDKNLDNNPSSSFQNNSNIRKINVKQEKFSGKSKKNIANEPITKIATNQITANPEINVGTTSYFFDVKINKNFLGKKRKKYIHTKYEKKNILTRIKKAAYNNYLKFTNKSIEHSQDEEIKKKRIKLRKISNSVIEVSSKQDNLDLIEMKMQDILSNPLPNNFKSIDKSYNKNSIDFILKRKDKKLTSILEKSFDDVIKIYADDLIDKDFDGFKTLKDHLKDGSKLGLEDQKYIELYTKYAKNFKKTYLDFQSPKKKKT